MTSYKRHLEENTVDSRRKEYSREFQESNHFLTAKSNTRHLRCATVFNVSSYFYLGISFPSHSDALPRISHSLISCLSEIYC